MKPEKHQKRLRRRPKRHPESGPMSKHGRFPMGKLIFLASSPFGLSLRPRRPKRHPRRSRMSPRGLQEGPRGGQDGPRDA
eukprot:2128221-Pyramimonas_sp.AAC.1